MNKDTQIQETRVSTLSIFKNNKKGTYIYHKIEKLSAALYIVSDLFENTEPMKLRLRNLSLDLVQLSSNVFNNLSDVEHKKSIEQISVSFLNVISLINVCYVSGLVSEMNHDVLKREFEEALNLVSVLYEQKNDQIHDDSKVLPRSFFDVSFDTDQTIKHENRFGSQLKKLGQKETGSQTDYKGTDSVSAEQKGHVFKKGTSFPRGDDVLRNNQVTAVNSVEQSVVNIAAPINTDSDAQTIGAKKSPFIFKGHVKDIRSGKAFESQVINSFKSTNRNELILSMLRSQGPLTVKDFSSKITDCSEKTIQRLLNTMVVEGTIKRVGERRWSRYLL